MTIITIGIDLAKNIFAVHGVNESGHTKLVKPSVSQVPVTDVYRPLFDWLGSLDSRGCGQEPVLQFNAGDHPYPHDGTLFF